MAGLTKNSATKKLSTRKQGTIEAIRHLLDSASVAILVEYRGLTVAELTKLRRELYKEQACFTVVKNTLAKRAITNGHAAVLIPAFKGPIAVISGKADQVAPVKIYTRLMKELKKESIVQAGYVDRQFLDKAQVEDLANLPPLNDLRVKLLGGIASPLNGIVAAVSGPQRSLVNVLDQLAKQKQTA